MSCESRGAGGRRGAGCLALGLLLAVVLGLPSLAGAQGKSGRPPRLLLLPIVVHSAEDPEYVRNGLADMLRSRFSRIGGIELLTAGPDELGTADVEDALELARKADADYVLFGSFTRFGQGASLDVQCAPVASGKSREPLREIFVHSGSIGEIIPDLDELAGKVSRFARGELAAPAAPGSGGPIDLAQPGGGAPGSSEELEGLRLRVEALEDTIQIMLEQLDGVGGGDPGAGELASP